MRLFPKCCLQSRIVWLLLQAGLASQTRDQPLNLSQLQDEHISTLEAAHPCRCSEIIPAAPALPLASLLLHLAALSTPWGAARTLVSTQTSFHTCRKSLATESGARSGPQVMLRDKDALGVRGWAPIPVQAPADPHWTRDQSPSPAGLSVCSCTMTSPDISSLG